MLQGWRLTVSYVPQSGMTENVLGTNRLLPRKLQILVTSTDHADYTELVFTSCHLSHHSLVSAPFSHLLASQCKTREKSKDSQILYQSIYPLSQKHSLVGL